MWDTKQNFGSLSSYMTFYSIWTFRKILLIEKGFGFESKLFLWLVKVVFLAVNRLSSLYFVDVDLCVVSIVLSCKDYKLIQVCYEFCVNTLVELPNFKISREGYHQNNGKCVKILIF